MVEMDQNTALSLAKTVWDYMDAQAASVEAGDDQGGGSGAAAEGPNDGEPSKAEGAKGKKKRARKPLTAQKDAVPLMTSLLESFVDQAMQRAIARARAEGEGQVLGAHVEQILPQLILDFF